MPVVLGAALQTLFIEDPSDEPAQSESPRGFRGLEVGEKTNSLMQSQPDSEIYSQRHVMIIAV